MSANAPTSPTVQNYTELQVAYDHFNRALFEGALPACLITLQREKRSFGYFSHQRFANLQGVMTDEIALNPAYFAIVPLVETMQTLVHEMVHLWQHHLGKPGRTRYHNDEWANKMQSIGLMPSSTGKPGGKRTGDHVADYAIEGGLFLQACAELVTKDFQISWYDRFPEPRQMEAGNEVQSMQLSASVGGGVTSSQSQAVRSALHLPAAGQAAPVKPPTRSKYTCACRQSVWGKPGLKLMCLLCSKPFLDCTNEAMAVPADSLPRQGV